MPLVEWEGVVERIDLDQQCFTAKLVDQRSPSVEIEYADFSFDQVDLDDRDLLRSGGVFRWVIGKRTNEFGRVENTSRLIFRRLPGYSKREIELADERASRWADALGAVAFFD